MSTINQLIKRKKYVKRTKNMVKSLEEMPFKRGVCRRVFIRKPKKPNSAQRKVARVELSNGKFVTAAIPGLGHNLQEHSVVLVRAGRANDLPGVRYKLVKGKYDFNAEEKIDRGSRRSKFGVKRKNK